MLLLARQRHGVTRSALATTRCLYVAYTHRFDIHHRGGRICHDGNVKQHAGNDRIDTSMSYLPVASLRQRDRYSNRIRYSKTKKRLARQLT